MEEQIKKAIYIGVDVPSDHYRETLLKCAGIGMLTARLIDYDVPSFIKTMDDVLEKESPEFIVLDENMPANLMMQTFTMCSSLEERKNKTVKVYGISDGSCAEEVYELSDDEIKAYLNKKSDLALIMGELDY